jgi:hypothetical protein
MSQYLVGFDRFISLEWANYAIELAFQPGINSEQTALLKEYLALSISGKVAVRKTANVLTRLWLKPDTPLDRFRDEALHLKMNTKKNDYVFFHWGLALMAFPLFREACVQIGRLAALQTTIGRQAIQSRVTEKYSNRETILRSVDNIFQSLIDWGLLVKIDKQSYIISLHASNDLHIKRWLLEVAVYCLPNKRAVLNEFYRLPELFPFEFNGDVRQIVNSSSHVKIERDGNNLEYICWSDTL